MKDQFVNFEIIKKNNKGDIYRRLFFWGFVFVLLFAIIFGEKVPGNVMGTMMLLMSAFFLFLAIKLQLVQEHDGIGWVMMGTNYLVVKIGDFEIEYTLDKTTKLSFEFRGYAGEPVIGQWIGDKKGYNNFISLTNDQGTEKYEVLVSNRMKISILERLIVYYRGLGVIVKFADRSSEDSKNSLILRLLLAIRGAR